MLLIILLGLVVVGITVVIQGYSTFFWLRKLQSYRSALTVKQLQKRIVMLKYLKYNLDSSYIYDGISLT